MEVKKVLERTDGVRYIIIPKKSQIKVGDMVLITNNLKLINKFVNGEKNGRRKEK